ncbi:Intracisternal A-particle Gag-related polyprotein [Trichinella pseudospiralis]
MNSQASPNNKPRRSAVDEGQPPDFLVSTFQAPDPATCMAHTQPLITCRTWCLDTDGSVRGRSTTFVLFPGGPWHDEHLRSFAPRRDPQSPHRRAPVQLRVASATAAARGLIRLPCYTRTLQGRLPALIQTLPPAIVLCPLFTPRSAFRLTLSSSAFVAVKSFPRILIPASAAAQTPGPSSPNRTHRPPVTVTPPSTSMSFMPRRARGEGVHHAQASVASAKADAHPEDEQPAGMPREVTAAAVTTRKEVEEDWTEVMRQLKGLLTGNTLATMRRPLPRRRRRPERKGNIRCWTCGGLGHISRECRASFRDEPANKYYRPNFSRRRHTVSRDRDPDY